MQSAVTPASPSRQVTSAIGPTTPPVNATVPNASGLPPVYRGHVQYVGFEQTGTVRAYRFRQILQEPQTRQFTSREAIVNADVTLFTKYHVGIQEGPALCLRLLSADANSVLPWPRLPFLSEGEIVAHVERKREAGAAAGKARPLR